MKTLIYYLHKRLYSLLHFEKNWRSLLQTFFEHPPFTTFLLFIIFYEVCNISNKYWLTSKSAKEIFLHKTPYTPPLFKKNCALHRRKFRKHPLFYHILVFTVDKVGNISNKYKRLSNFVLTFILIIIIIICVLMLVHNISAKKKVVAQATLSP